MLFNSFDFLFFFPIAVGVFYILKHKYRWIWLLSCSYFFYMYLEPTLLLLLLFSTCVDYYCGLQMHKCHVPKVRKRFLWLSITVNLGLLFFFKYFVFFTENAVQTLQFFGIDIDGGEQVQHTAYVKILLPIGISFYTFQTLSYSFDVYRRQVEPVRHFGKYALYVAFFPQLVAGPIERTKRLLPQFYKKVHFDGVRIKKGLIMMAWGFFLKLVVADRLGVYVDDIFYRSADYRGWPLVIGAYFFAFQIYFDFSAYCTIAIGAAQVLGYNLMQNFNRPFFLASISDFWKKWHISLMKWFRDYLYIPLVRKLKFPKTAAILVVFFFNGLWHGASWTFVVWGVLCGLLMIADTKTTKSRRFVLKKLGIDYKWKPVRVLNGFLLFSLLIFILVFFRAPNISHAIVYLKNIVSVHSTPVNVLNDWFEFYLSLGLIFLVQVIHFYKGNDKVYELVWKRPRWVRWGIYAMFILIMVLFSVNRQNNFIYFQF